MDSAQHTSFCPEGSRLTFTAFLMRDRARDWCEEVGHVMRAEVVEAMNWPNFVTRFKSEFAPTIKVKQLARELQDLF